MWKLVSKKRYNEQQSEIKRLRSYNKTLLDNNQRLVKSLEDLSIHYANLSRVENPKILALTQKLESLLGRWK